MAHTFEDHVQLEQAAEEAHTRYTAPDTDDVDGARLAWLKAAGKFQTAVTEHAQAEGKPRIEVEMAVKKTVRHPELAA
mgnify:CR=1 FL=1